jgi:hypothetical protein
VIWVWFGKKQSLSPSEGIVAKYKHGAYGRGWLTIKNPDYSQGKDRWELFGISSQAPVSRKSSQ